MLNFILGKAGTGKTHHVFEKISEKLSLEEDVIVIVPDQFSFEYNLMLYRFLGAQKFNLVSVYGFTHLPNEIFKNSGKSCKNVANDSVKSIVMYSALEKLLLEKSLQFYAVQATLPTFCETALELIKVFASNNITPEKMAETLPFLNGNLEEKIADITLIYTTYSKLLEEKGYRDNFSDMAFAGEVLKSYNFFQNKNVFIDEFRSFTADQYEVLHNITLQSNDIFISLTTDNLYDSKYSLFENVNLTIGSLCNFATEHFVKINKEILTEKRRYLHEELAFLSDNIFEISDVKFPKKSESITLFEAEDFYAEAEFISAEILRAVQNDGRKFSDFAIVSRQKEDYDFVIETAFKRNNIPFHTDSSLQINHYSISIFIVSALRLAMKKKPSTEDCLKYIKTGFLSFTPEEISILEDYCYKWSVDGKMWTEKFLIWDESPEDISAENSRVKIITPILNLQKKCEKASASNICVAISEFLEEINFENSLEGFLNEFCENDEDKIIETRLVKQVWDEILNVFETLYSLLGDEIITLSKFTNLFETILQKTTISSPPQTLDCVAFSSVKTARLASPKIVFIIGANDGILPYTPKQSPYISDRDIETLKSQNLVLSGSISDKTAEEKLVTYYCLSSASEKIYFTYSLTSLSGNGLYPSYLIEKITKMFGDEILIRSKDLDPYYFCNCVNSAYYSYVSNFEKNANGKENLKISLEKYSTYFKEKIEFLEHITSRIMNESISQENAKNVYGKNLHLSVSRFEDYNKCPFMYFCKKGLELYIPEKIELNFSLHGNIVHYCLCEVLKNLEDLQNTSDETLKREILTCLENYYRSTNIGDNFGKTKRFITQYFLIADTVYDVLQNIKSEFADSNYRPVGFEYSLSKGGDEPEFVLKASDGSNIFFDGTIDRIDAFVLDDITYIRVIDYKTGEKKFKISDLYYGLNMQLLLYLFALTDVNVPLNSGKFHASIPSGALYMPAIDVKPAINNRHPSEEEILSQPLKNYKKTGAILDNPEIIEAMDKNEKPVFIQKSSANSKYFSEEEFEAIRKYSMNFVVETSAKIKSGEIAALPLVNKKDTPCMYCDYKSLCDNYPNITVRNYDVKNSEQIITETIEKLCCEEDSYVNNLDT